MRRPPTPRPREPALQTAADLVSTRRNALVTGASRGIGLAIARRLAGEGFDLTISARSADALGKVAAELRATGSRVAAVPADMSDERQVDALAAAHEQTFDVLDVLVLCAGLGSLGVIADYPVRRLDRMFAINLRGPFTLTQRLLPSLRRAALLAPTGAKVIAIASLTGIAASTCGARDRACGNQPQAVPYPSLLISWVLRSRVRDPESRIVAPANEAPVIVHVYRERRREPDHAVSVRAVEQVGNLTGDVTSGGCHDFRGTCKPGIRVLVVLTGVRRGPRHVARCTRLGLCLRRR